MEASLPQLILPIQRERSSERLSSLGGLVVLEELARAVKLWEGDWLRRQGRAGAEAMQQVSRKLVACCFEQEEVILDVDATEIEAEKQDAAWTYNHVQGYMPLLGYVNGVCVGQQFRQGNQSPSAGILEFAQSCEAALPAGKLVRHARGGVLQIKADLEKWRLLQSARVCCATLRT